ncbi:hypothetical protein ABZ671_15645 [Micromonospora sp. NPDC006766]|uniref:hypothetical protein n=1 Tax=Micromonospora sp. NPDC006766 TaxID=3154778 RepID=UPI0033C45082
MLVSLYRTGPMRHRIVKGFVVAAADAARVVGSLDAVAGHLPGHPDGRFTLRRDQRAPGVVWLDTGMVWLIDQDSRDALRRALAEATVGLAEAVRARGGRLVPGGWLGAAGGPDWLCADVHAVEVVTDTQRELCSNLFRRWVPELVALSGHAAFGGRRVERGGSRRLADARDHLSTRYLASAGAAHLDRVRASLRRDEGVSRLELMDVNPVGLPDPVPNVVVRCLDAQILPATVIAQAILVQAIAMRARLMERDGRRVPAVDQNLLDRNRSRAISGGLGAMFDGETDDRRPAGRAGRDRRPDRRGPDRRESDRHDSGRRETDKSDGVPARERVLALVEDLTRELQAMRVQAEEIAPIVLGLTMAGSHPLAVRSEDDLLARWAGGGSDLDASDFFADPAWLDTDQVSVTNEAAYRGAAAMARHYWAKRLRPAPRSTPDKHRPDRANQTERTERGMSAGLLLNLLGTEEFGAEQVTEALATYVRGGGAPDLTKELRKLPNEQAKALRRTLRPPRPLIRETSSVPKDWSAGPAAEVLRLATKEGRALLSLKIPADQRPQAIAAVRQQLHRPPPDLALLLLTDASFRDPKGASLVRVELLVLSMKVEATP